MKKIRYALFVMLVMISISGCSAGRKNISLSPYIMTSISGLSGRATATAYLDTAGIYSALAGIDAAEEEKAKYDAFVASLELTCDKLDKLANGDAINLTVTYDAAAADELKINVNDFVKKGSTSAQRIFPIPQQVTLNSAPATAKVLSSGKCSLKVAFGVVALQKKK